MKNIPQKKLENIANEAFNLTTTINNSIDWLNQHEQTKNKSKQDIYKLKEYRRQLQKIASGVVQKNAIGLFGKSQVGKSYLVKNILSDINNYLYITNPLNPDIKLDFHREINPDGQGQESTGVVTRFTCLGADEIQNNYIDFPVKIKLLRPVDFVLILIDTFRSDILNYKLSISKEELQHLLSEDIKSLCMNDIQNYFREDDVYLIREYIVRHDGEESILIPFWDEVAKIIHKVPAHNWSKIFAILWNNNYPLTQLFNDLINELKKVDFQEVVHAKFESIERRNNSIVSVTRLKNLNKNDSTQVKLTDGREIDVNVHRLGAITKELILNVSNESAEAHPFIKETDILDFPGARTRKKFGELTKDNLGECLIRGKVAYLFNTYSSNYETNNLFVCTPDGQNNVPLLPHYINQWIGDNIGTTKEERSETLGNYESCPLFLIFTFWNNQLKYHANADGMNASLDYKWQKRFDIFYVDGVIGDPKSITWDKEWTNNSAFQNYYLLRDFEYSSDIFVGYNPEQAGSKEQAVLPVRKNFYNRLQQSFINSPIINKFFSDPQDIWQKTSTPTNDGSQHIISNIKKAANNIVKTNRFEKMLYGVKNKVENILQDYYHSDDVGTEILKAERQALDIAGQMTKVFGENLDLFGSFIEKLSVSEKEILDIFHEEFDSLSTEKETDQGPYVLFLSRSPRLSPENTDEENIQIIAEDYKLLGLSSQEIINRVNEKFGINLKLLFEDWNTQNNPSLTLAKLASNIWGDQLSMDNFTVFIDRGLEENLLAKLFDNLKKTYGIIDLDEIISSKIKSYVDLYKKTESAKELIADLAATSINNFVQTSGWDKLTEEQKDKIRQTCNNHNLVFRIPNDKEDTSDLSEVEVSELFEFITKMNKMMTNRSMNRTVLTKVPVIKHFNQWIDRMQLSFIANCQSPDYNIEGNKKMGEIIKQMQQISKKKKI